VARREITKKRDGAFGKVSKGANGGDVASAGRENRVVQSKRETGVDGGQEVGTASPSGQTCASIVSAAGHPTIVRLI
jgi:hypothetical protein